MKKIACLLLLVSYNFTTAQTPVVKNIEESSLENQIYSLTGIEGRPEFHGGLSAFYQYISENYNLPQVKNLKGKVFVTFVIEKDGSLTDIKILRDIGHGTGEEAVRVLKNSPKWIPATQNGQPVRVQYSLPLSINTN